MSLFSKAEAPIPQTDIPSDIYSSRVKARIAEYGANPGIDNAGGNGHIDIAELDEARSGSDAFVEAHRPQKTIKPEPPPLVTEQPLAYPPPPRTLAERIGPDAVYPSADGHSLWPDETASSAVGRPEVGTEEPTFKLSEEETDEPATHNEVAKRIALVGLISSLRGRARKTLYPLAEAVSQVSFKEPYGRAKESVRGRYEQLKSRKDSRDQAENNLLATESSESWSDRAQALTVIVGAVAWGGFKKSLESAPKLNRPDIDLAKYAKKGAIALNATINLSSRSYEKAKSLAKDEKHHETRRNLAIGTAAVIGSVAVAAAVGVAGYYINKMGHTHQPSQEAINHTPAQQTKFPELTLPPALQVAKDHAVHHLRAVAKHAGYHVEHLKYYGDTIWYHAKANVIAKFPHASQEKIGELTNKYSQLIVRVNHIKDTTHMLLGQHFKMPNLRLK